ncbi:MAG: ribosome biogenesis GTP-binding protein YihA/YsxC [Anderseniella sp.]
MREYEEHELERGRLLFAGQTVFRMGVARLQQLPPEYPLEVAFAGRSNVGKSSLLNALTGRKDIARTSNTPGRTRELNFFELADGAVALVDMPGYGYARAQKTMVKAWQSIIMGYLQGRPNLRRVFVLIDARHGIKSIDLTTLDQLDEAAVSYQIILTKSDKIRKDEHDKVMAATTLAIARRPAAFPEIILTSSEKGSGIPQLRAEIAGLMS